VRVNPFDDDLSHANAENNANNDRVFPGFSSLDRPNFAMKLPLSATARKRIDDAGSRVDKFSRENRSFLPEKAYHI
jgi:hypothetical protein|tara:strand:- start:9956 stop:10183 length:228 start_codon:yes stop_codon:yes gene_type:complete